MRHPVTSHHLLFGLAVLVIVGGFAAIGAASCGEEDAPALALTPNQPLIVLAAPDAEAWVRLERASGAAARIGTLDELLTRTEAVVPAGAKLSSSDHYRIHNWVAQGGRLVSPHEDLLAGLGFTRSAAEKITQVTLTDGSNLVAQWPDGYRLQGLAAGKSLRSFTPMVVSDGTAIIAQAALGKGHVFGIAIDPMADGKAGFEFVPTLGREIATWTKAPPGPERDALEIYLDPGSLPDSLKHDPEKLAASLAGVHAVQIAGWNFNFRDPADDYDYAGLISALHARGILAYAWLEPPFVNLLMWEDHPECREKTATGRDAMVDWRALIALEDPKCFELAWKQWQVVLNTFDWDGINIAELYFEPDIKQDNFTPFHPSALARFGGEPSQEFARFRAFRKDLVVELNEKLLSRINGLPRAKELTFQLTVIDDRLDPVHGDAVGSDVARLAEVARAGGASLQVEDPFTTWEEGPLRYLSLAPVITPLLPKGKVFIDINVVPRENARPTSAMTGGELDLAAMAAGSAGMRLAVFSVATVPARDLAHLGAAIAGSAQTLDTGVRAPATLLVRSPYGSASTTLTVDGVEWPAAPGFALIPAGEHRLEWGSAAARGPALLRLGAELGSATVAPNTVTFTYDAPGRSYAVIDREPLSMKLDGTDADLQVLARPEGGWVLVLPGGTHELAVTTDVAPEQP